MKKIIALICMLLVCFISYSKENCFASSQEVYVPAIMYHSIYEGRNNAYVLSPTKLEQDLIYLKENGYNTIFISQLIDYVDGKEELPEKPIIITFDDGYYNNYATVYPLVKKYNAKCNISVVGSYIDKKEEYRSKYFSYMNWEEVKELASSPYFEIHNHSYDLHSITYKRHGVKKNSNEDEISYKQTLLTDTKKCENKLEELIGKQVKCYCYPFGIYDELSDSILKESGYRVVLTCQEKINKINKNQDLIRVSRYNRPCWTSTYEFFSKIEKDLKN